MKTNKEKALMAAMMLPMLMTTGSALAAPGELYVHNHKGTGMGRWLKPAYESAGAKDRLHRQSAKADPEKVIGWLLK